jgi:general nucleoside transport system permease protein
VLTMMISGFLAGFGGGVQTLGIVGRFQPGFNAGLGFEGITVALLAKTHPIGVIPAALLLGAMSAGSNLMQFSAGVPNQITDVITAFILFFVAADVIVKRLLRQRVVDDEKITLSSGWGSH